MEQYNIEFKGVAGWTQVTHEPMDMETAKEHAAFMVNTIALYQDLQTMTPEELKLNDEARLERINTVIDNVRVVSYEED